MRFFFHFSTNWGFKQNIANIERVLQLAGVSSSQGFFSKTTLPGPSALRSLQNIKHAPQTLTRNAIHINKLRIMPAPQSTQA